MKKLLTITFLLASCLTYAQRTLTTGGKLKPEQAIIDVKHYTIALNVNIPDRSINGYTIIDVNLLKPTNRLVFDLLDSFNVSKVTVNNAGEKFTYKNDLITIETTKTLQPGRIKVRVDYDGKPHIAVRPPWEDGFIWKTDSEGMPRVEVTAEGGGGKIYFPCKDHPSDEPEEGVDMMITVPANLVVAGPGLLVDTKKEGNSATYHWRTRYSINNYNIIFNAANYAVVSRNFKTVAGNTVPIQFYVLKMNQAKAEHHLDIFERTIKMHEKYFGEYPWVKEKIGIVETTHLGMEHQTMNAYGANFRYTKVGGHDFDGLMHHEFGHEWWGNKVTANDWADFWIQEGICTFGDALFVRDHVGQQAFVDGFKRSASRGFSKTHPIVLGKDIDGKTAYKGDIYSKGAYFMFTLANVMGDETFYPALKKFATSPEYTFENRVVTADVEKFFSKAAGRNLKPLFDLFIYTTDKLKIIATKTGTDQYAIKFENMSIPLPVQVTADGVTKKMTLSNKAVTLTSKTPPIIDPDWYYYREVVIN